MIRSSCSELVRCEWLAVVSVLPAYHSSSWLPAVVAAAAAGAESNPLVGIGMPNPTA